MRLTVALLVAGIAPAQHVAVRGVYGDPRPLWAKSLRLDELRINAVFVHSGSINRELMARAAAEGAKVYAEFATLNGKGYVEKHPEAWPINEQGQPAAAASWFLGACPTDPGFKAWRMKQLTALLDDHDVAGVWMDYLHWHAQFEEPRPILPETCFNTTCLARFASDTGVRLPEKDAPRFILAQHDRQWRDWRASMVTEWARDIRALVRRKRPAALLGNYQCPWTDEEFAGARRRTLGLDLDGLAEVVDVFSPMVYHGRMGRSPAWVGEYLAWFSNRLPKARIWPIVQAHETPAGEFAEVMRHGAAEGVQMFTTRAVADDPAKLGVLRSLYRDWSRRIRTIASGLANPYGLVIAPDGGLYFCEVDSHKVRRLDLESGRLTTVAGNGQKGYSGDGGPATEAVLNQPYEVRFDAAGNMYFVEMQNHVVRRVDVRTGTISTVAGAGSPGFSGDGGPALHAQFRQPHSIAFDPQGGLLICDIGNHRVRRVDLATGLVTTFLEGFKGPRAMDFDPQGNLYLALREGNAVYRIDPRTKEAHHLAGTGEKGYSGDGGPARLARLSGPKGIAWSPDGGVYIADTESHTIRRIDLATGIITTVAGTGARGDGGEPDPLRCGLARPHGVFAGRDGRLYIGDSETHRLRVLE